MSKTITKTQNVPYANISIASFFPISVMTSPLGTKQLVNVILTVTNFTLNEKQNVEEIDYQRSDNIVLFEKGLSDTFQVFENENLDEKVETSENVIHVDLNTDDNTSFKNSGQKEYQESSINSKRSRKLPKKFTEFEMY